MSSEAAVPAVGELEKLRINNLISLLQNLYQVVGFVGIVRCEERVRRSGFLSAACTADPMNVVFRARWVVKVDNKLDILNV